MHKFGVWSPTWGRHFLIETGQVYETWDLTLKLGNCTSQKILSVLDPVVKVSNIIWSVCLTAECAYRRRADGITGRCAATDVCFMLHSSALSATEQTASSVTMQQPMSALCCAVVRQAKCCRAGGTISHYAALHLLSAGLRSIEQTRSLLLYFQALNTILYCIYQ